LAPYKPPPGQHHGSSTLIGSPVLAISFPRTKQPMTDVVHLCAAIENCLRTADPARRQAVSKAFDGYARSFPQDYEWAISGQAPALLHFLMGSIEMTCAEAPSKSKPDLRVVEFKKMEPAHV
jgi:hypothetical protein